MKQVSKTHISFHTVACPRCSGHNFPVSQLEQVQDHPTSIQEKLTSISSSLLTRIPFRFTTCRYLRPLRTSWCTWKTTLTRYVAPSLIVKGLSFRPSRAPGAERSMTTSGRPSTSRARDLMMHFRGSLGSPRDSLLSPREAFQRFRDSSFWSVGGSQVCQWVRCCWFKIARREVWTGVTVYA